MLEAKHFVVKFLEAALNKWLENNRKRDHNRSQVQAN